MLRWLGKWLRAAGYDTMTAEGGVPDRVVAAHCAIETRILLTKDRHLAATAKGVARVVLVAAGGIDEGAVVLRAALDLDWQHAPFTRCILDNRPLEPAPADLAARVPERLRSAAGPVQRCAECGRLDWPGGHVRRMQLRLAPSSPRPEEERKGRMQPGAVTGPLMG